MASSFLLPSLLFALVSFSSSIPLPSYPTYYIRQVTDNEPQLDRASLSYRGIPIKVPHDLLHAKSHFHEFISIFGKTYSSPQEHAHRFRVFKDNLAKAVEHQLLDPSATHGVTKFSDLTEEEFRDRYLGLKKPPLLRKSGHDAPILPTNDLPSSFDWRDRGAVTEVKNQGSCGSCWSFSTTGAVEGAHFLATGQLLNLSEQQLVDCDHVCDPEDEQGSCDLGCKGGLMTNAFNYIMEAGGLQLEKDYPYQGIDGRCKFDKNKIAARITNFTNIGIDEDQIAANLVKYGPLAIGINAKFMQTYIGGVSCPYICNKHLLNHGVLLVGFGEKAFSPIRLKQKPYWIIKNSWGSNWGEHGYYKLCRGYNECGMSTLVSSVAANPLHG